ncbi:MAG: aminodeoxychorismate/anthranilate synthase component II [Eubacterium sp.]|nr:aminodeoxychorismate/anthranilate synthase component II [Eubacterium sp.]MCM1417268.1 aminodeoxychorismate/anthranilate synthase component II [Roseburia sp.]
MILLIDNYDSFSYNLYQLVGELEPNIRVVRNDELSPEDAFSLNPSRIILSPGPKTPSEAGICEELVKRSDGSIPILGVCLGHQAICEAFGATVSYAKKLMHGKRSTAKLDIKCPLFYGLPGSTEVARYHSLAAIRETLPACLTVTAETDDGEVMSVRHTSLPIYGVQFHPESILTAHGKKMLENFLSHSIF